MQAINKLKELVRNLERNLHMRSMDILPIVREVLKDLEEMEVEAKQQPKQEPVTGEVEYTEEIKNLARKYLKEKKVKWYWLLKRNNIVVKAIENGFTI